MLRRPTEPVRLYRSRRSVLQIAVPLIPVVAAAFLPGPFFDAAVYAGSMWVMLSVFFSFMRTWIDLSPDGIATDRAQYPWEGLDRIEVTDGRLARRVRFVRDGKRIDLTVPAAMRTALRRGGATEFDVGVAELRRWAEEYAPQAEVVYRRHGPAWTGDLVCVLMTSALVLLDAMGRVVFH